MGQVDTRPTVVCRTRAHPQCYNGRKADYEDIEDYRSDSTYRGDTVVCTACYILIEPFMRMNSDDVPGAADAAAAVYFDQLHFIRHCEDPAEYEAKAQLAMESASPGSPWYTSAFTCRQMARDEIERRKEQT